MESEILKTSPLSGKYEEHRYDATGNTMWVKFLDSEYLEWCGVFGLGWKSAQKEAHIKPNSNLCYVLAGGQFYIINIDTRELITKSKEDDIESFLFHTKTGYLIATDGLEIIIFEKEQIIWSSGRVSLDGLVFLKQDGNTVSGKLNDCTEEWGKFSFNVVEKTISADWLFSENLA